MSLGGAKNAKLSWLNCLASHRSQFTFTTEVELNRVFILGAGFSYHISGGGLPLMAQLGDEFKEQHTWTSAYFPEGSTASVNLESVLTRLHLDLQDERLGQTRNP